VDLIFPLTRGTTIENIEEKSEHKWSSLAGNSSKGSKEGSSEGELRSLEAPQGATEQIPCMQGAILKDRSAHTLCGTACLCAVMQPSQHTAVPKII
jgi:hypothetical protein